jgi:hypothetical protein
MDTLLALRSANKESTSHKAYHFPSSQEIYSQLGKSCEYIMYSGFILPLLQVHLEQLGLVWKILLMGTDGFSYRSLDVYFISAVYFIALRTLVL